MRAVRWHGRADVRLDEVPEPEPAPDELLLRVAWCGICGSDLEEYRSGPIAVPVAPEPHPRRGSVAPIVLGHEVVGRVVRAAADGSGPREGALVVPDVVLGCGECWWCARHEVGLCSTLAVRGQTEDGGLAELMVARAATCLEVPGGVTAEEAALVEPASVAVRAVRAAGATAGRVAVVGSGTVGQLVARVARARGWAVGLMVDPDVDRRARAVRFGAERGAAPDEATAIARAEPLGGFDVVFECSGAAAGLGLACDLARRGGRIIALGLRAGAVELDLVDLVLGEKTIAGSAAHLWDDDSAVALDLIASGTLPVADLVTHRIPLAEVVEHGFALLADGGSGALKVLVDCG
ncbi:alcohol dehydrogenase catalytic domain-containing protein [Herbiconiux sp. KACC 21604]|uniref:alcohol dehydrogenase catalytic domain-containing protein n=1 Tax=unclassified Herbiconiux TaxID=2618217 RepID=UPI001491C667|nr:alcohol dehydrogenase catalytic domain-containing protein [Herbiconiux sp. SALV-R1]QJU55226.1 alcohol dehydrogenase catalytic domain-containing protein [Herbiconiux sp. SALV-R1]WPO86391.1 alcohol dehydrogenase catalytic domain-containing protein [Herbiconiux sp. KACC 21604]